MKAINAVIEEVMAHPLEERELITEILRKRMIEEKRNIILKEYRRASKNYRTGRVKTGTASDLFRDLD